MVQFLRIYDLRITNCHANHHLFYRKFDNLIPKQGSLTIRLTFVLPSLFLRSGSARWDYRMNGPTTDLQRTYNGPTWGIQINCLLVPIRLLAIIYWRQWPIEHLPIIWLAWREILPVGRKILYQWGIEPFQAHHNEL